jgi:hypothetical protein
LNFIELVLAVEFVLFLRTEPKEIPRFWVGIDVRRCCDDSSIGAAVVLALLLGVDF